MLKILLKTFEFVGLRYSKLGRQPHEFFNFSTYYPLYSLHILHNAYYIFSNGCRKVNFTLIKILRVKIDFL